MTISRPGPGVVTAATPARPRPALREPDAAAAKKKVKALVKPVRVVVTKAGKVRLSIRPTPARRGKVLNRQAEADRAAGVTYSRREARRGRRSRRSRLRLKQKARH